MSNPYDVINQVALKRAIWGKRDAIAAMLGISPTSLSRKIHGRQRMFVDELVRIADFVQVDVRLFLQRQS